MSGLFINTLTADDKYCRHNMENFTIQVQTPWSLKKEDIIYIFSCISKMCMKFRTIWKKDESPSLSISKIIESKGDCYLNV